MLKRLLLSGAALASLAGAALAGEAQSIGVNLTGGGGTFLITQTNTYKFNPATAAGFYTNTLTAGPLVRCFGFLEGPCDSNQPGTPAAPNPDPNEVAQQATSDECTFANGGVLGGHTYEQELVVVVARNDNGRLDHWQFLWTYTVGPDPTKPSPVAALTAWDPGTPTPGTAQVTLGATIASESVTVASHFPTGKYSFALASTLSPGVPDQTTNRVTRLTWTIKDATNNVVAQQAAGSMVVDNKPGSTPYGGPPALDFTYTAIAGTFGKVSNALMESDNSAATPAEAMARSGLCEGVHTCGVLVDLAHAKDIDMPIAAAVDAVLAERIGVEEAIAGLLARPSKAEFAGSE